jgi:heme-degrading monooxygenase HmoA
MFARVSTYEGDTSRLAEGFEASRERLKELSGFVDGYLLVDGESGRAETITFWETREAVDASAAEAHRMRSEATEPSGVTTTSVHTYEVALSVRGRLEAAAG